MHKSIIIISIIVILSSASECKGSVFLSEKYEVQPISKRVSFGCICNLIIDEPLEKEIRDHFANTINNKPQQCRSAIAWEWFYCANKQMKLINMLNQLTYTHKRNKRSISSWIDNNAKMLLEIGGEAASIFIKGISSNPLIGTMISASKTLLEQLMQQSKSEYASKSIVPYDQIQRTIADVSIFAGKRTDHLIATVESET